MLLSFTGTVAPWSLVQVVVAAERDVVGTASVVEDADADADAQHMIGVVRGRGRLECWGGVAVDDGAVENGEEDLLYGTGGRTASRINKEKKREKKDE